MAVLSTVSRASIGLYCKNIIWFYKSGILCVSNLVYLVCTWRTCHEVKKKKKQNKNKWNKSALNIITHFNIDCVAHFRKLWCARRRRFNDGCRREKRVHFILISVSYVYNVKYTNIESSFSFRCYWCFCFSSCVVVHHLKLQKCWTRLRQGKKTKLNKNNRFNCCFLCTKCFARWEKNIAMRMRKIEQKHCTIHRKEKHKKSTSTGDEN